MKRYTLLLLIFFYTVSFGGQVSDADKIIGVWKSPDNSYMIKIDKIGNHFQGRIVWLSSNGQSKMKLDVNNPNEQLRNLPLKGNKIIEKLSYSSSESLWNGGTFYSFTEGKVYNCQISLHSSNQIKILKYIRNQQEGKTETWTRQQ
jgi:uncharacterized protein (DUF2147 family)